MILESGSDSRVRIGIKAWFIGIGVGIGIILCWNQNQVFWKHWNRNQNWNHLLLESALETESWILVNPGPGIRISPSGTGIGIVSIKIYNLWNQIGMRIPCHNCYKKRISESIMLRLSASWHKHVSPFLLSTLCIKICIDI